MAQARARQKPLREAAKNWIFGLAADTVFHLSELYRFLIRSFRDLCEARGHATHEPQYRNDARWAVQDLEQEREIAPTGRRGEYRRTRPLGRQL